MLDLGRRLDSEGSIEWSSEVRIGTRGLEIASDDGSCECVAWSRITRLDIEGEVLRCWVDAETSPRVQIPTTLVNFYPLYLLVSERRKVAG
jgi:hypothetical protein